jgi:hypothetical protein
LLSRSLISCPDSALRHGKSRKCGSFPLPGLAITELNP